MIELCAAGLAVICLFACLERVRSRLQTIDDD